MHASFRAVHHSKVGPEENACVCVRLRERASEKARGEGERSRARMRNVTHVNNAYRSPRASLPESRSFGSQPTYYLFIRTVPGWSATWRNRLREFAEPAFLAQAPSELCFHSFRFGLSIPVSLHLLLSPPFTLFFFRTALLNLLSPPLFALRALPSSFFKLIHPLSSFLEHRRLLSFYRVVGPPPSASFLLSSPLRTLIPWLIM